MKVTKHEQSLIHEVMLMAYEQGIEEGRKQAMEEIRKWQKDEQKKTGDFSHHPNPNSYAAEALRYYKQEREEQEAEDNRKLMAMLP